MCAAEILTGFAGGTGPICGPCLLDDALPGRGSLPQVHRGDALAALFDRARAAPSDVLPDAAVAARTAEALSDRVAQRAAADAVQDVGDRLGASEHPIEEALHHRERVVDPHP